MSNPFAAIQAAAVFGARTVLPRRVRMTDAELLKVIKHAVGAADVHTPFLGLTSDQVAARNTELINVLELGPDFVSIPAPAAL